MSTPQVQSPLATQNPDRGRDPAGAGDRPPVTANVAPAARPSSVQHRVFLALSVAVVAASLLLGVGDSNKVVLPVVEAPLPSVCQLKNITGLDCPGCGLSRSFINIAHGDLHAAWGHNPAGGLVFLFVLAQIPYRCAQLWRIRRGLPELNWPRLSNWSIGIVCTALVAQWLVKTSWWLMGA